MAINSTPPSQVFVSTPRYAETLNISDESAQLLKETRVWPITGPNPKPIFIETVNKYHGFDIDDKKGNYYIGRGSPVGNPYTVEQYGRTDAIERYKEWLNHQILTGNTSVIEYLDRITDATIARADGTRLVCFCKPKSCHGDYICQIIKQKVREKCES